VVQKKKKSALFHRVKNFQHSSSFLQNSFSNGALEKLIKIIGIAGL
jgi:hypothetical protein